MKKHQDSEKEKSISKDFWQGFYAGFAIIIISGLGDKLFFLNMIYASINSFCNAFWVALAISEIMNLINISLGELLKKYISISVLDSIAISVFVLLGFWLIIKGIRMQERRLIQNYDEERKLLINNKNKNNLNENNDEEANDNDENNYRRIEIGGEEENAGRNEIGVFDSWWKYFITYFFASGGDKSQIASIIISSKYNFISIFNGTAIAILLLVLIAMILGKTISKLLTNKQISIIGGIFFLLYAAIFFVDKKISKNNKYLFNN